MLCTELCPRFSSPIVSSASELTKHVVNICTSSFAMGWLLRYTALVFADLNLTVTVQQSVLSDF